MSDIPRQEPELEQKDRQPVFNLPFIIVLLIAAFLLIHGIRLYWLTYLQDNNLIRGMAFVPGRMTMAFDPDGIVRALTALASNTERFQIADFLLGDRTLQPWTVLTYAFLHGDWVHVAMNSVWFAIFGAPVARRFGTMRFVALFIVTAIAGVAAHWGLHRYEFVPVVGASAAVSGVMAAALRFVFQPGGPLGPAVAGWRLPPDYSAKLPALALRDVVRDRRVMQFILIWFVINLLFGLFSVQFGATTATVAWEAHVGGFVAGFLLFSLFDPRPPDPDEFAQFHQPAWRQ